MANTATAAPARKGLRARFTHKRPTDAASAEDFGPEYYGKPPRPWPVVLLALPAYVAIWGGWVELGRMCGFGPVNLLPGIGDGLVVDLAITLPFGMEVYAAYAMSTWLSKKPVHPTARKFAMWSSIAALVLGSLGQVAYHLLVASSESRSPRGGSWSRWPACRLPSSGWAPHWPTCAPATARPGPPLPRPLPHPRRPRRACPGPDARRRAQPVPVVYSPTEPVPAPTPVVSSPSRSSTPPPSPSWHRSPSRSSSTRPPSSSPPRWPARPVPPRQPPTPPARPA